jgi:hypothetical protein
MLPPIYSILTDSAAVTTIIGANPTRAYRHRSAVQDTTRPYVTWALAGGIPENELSAAPVVDRMSVDIDCWHLSDEGVEQLAAAVRDAVEASGHVTGISPNLREAETKLYRITIQADIWLYRAAAGLNSSSI